MKAIAAILAFVTLGLGVTASDGPAAAARRPAGNARPNIVFILTDDQRWDSLAPVQKPDGTWVRPMPNVDDLLAAKGMTLTNYFLSLGLCCPSRTSIMRGQYAHSTGVYSISGHYGGWPAFHRNRDDRSNIATWLQGAGYRTGLVGKFLNGYGHTDAAIVPPGWSEWDALTRDTYFRFAESINGVETRFGPNHYQTDELGRQAVDFIRTTEQDTPLFLYWAPHAPHAPAIPARRDDGSFAWMLDDGYRWRPSSYNEPDVSDKPPFMQAPRMTKEDQDSTDLFREHQYESLQAVDRWIGEIIDALRQSGRLSNTLIMFSSDNGMMWGEHRLAQMKNLPYEEAIRSPFIARWDGVIPAGAADGGHLAVNIDIAPTLADVAGVSPPYQVEGVSLLRLLKGTSPDPWRHAFLLEHMGGANLAPAYCGVRTDAGFDGSLPHVPFAYVWYLRKSRPNEELYDLIDDPLEEHNLANSREEAGVVARLRQWVDAHCSPPPP